MVTREKTLSQPLIATSPVAGGRQALKGAVCFAVIALFAFLAVYRLQPPAPVPATAPAGEFSSARAMNHLRFIAEEPRPIGSTHHAETRDYIINQLTGMGLSPEVQRTMVTRSERRGSLVAASVSNIVAVLKGTNSSKSILLVAHYDTVQSSKGASDDGAGVAALLESLRALKAGPPLANDVIFLFTDAEEVGLLGAKAFIDKHPLAAEVGLVINLEARGHSGPSIMFETSPNNGWLIDHFAQAAPHPIANSLSYEVYRLLPNDTDLSEFKDAGFAGLNFAFIDGATHYHTLIDNLTNIDESSLQHQGSSLLALTNHFGNLPLDNVKAANAVYFDLLGLTVLRYSGKLVLPLMILALLVFILIAALGFKKGQLKSSRVALGSVAVLAVMLIVAGVVTALWWGIESIHPQYKLLVIGDTYNSHYYIVGFVALALAITTGLFNWASKKTGMLNLMAGSMFWWLALTVASSLFLPGGSYLFVLPLLLGLLSLGACFLWEQQNPSSMKLLLILNILALPAIILFSPLISLMFSGIGVGMAGAIVVLVVLLAGLLIPQLVLIMKAGGRLVPASLALVSLAFIVAGSFTSGFGENSPKPNSLFYALNSDNGNAIWASADRETDEWTRQFFSQGVDRSALPEFFPSSSRRFIRAEAARTALEAPDIKLIGEEKNNGIRRLHLRVNSPRQAPCLVMLVESSQGKFDAEIGTPGEILTAASSHQLANDRWMLRYFGLPAEGVDLILETDSSEPLKMRVVDESYGLPVTGEVAYKPRPNYMIPSLFTHNDTTIVRRSFSF